MARYITFGGQPIVDPRQHYKNAARMKTPMDFWGRANSYRCPRGPNPGVAWLLMTKASLDSLNLNSEQILYFVDGGNTMSIPLIVRRAVNMNLGLASDSRAAYLVECADRRVVLKRSSINAQYNVRQPAPEDTDGDNVYYSWSKNAGSAYTWQTMIDDIWTNLPATERGTTNAPTLPYTPTDDPENFRFVGVSAWDALHVVLEQIGCTTAYNPIAQTFSFVRLGDTQAGLAASMATFENVALKITKLLYDYNPYDGVDYAEMPATIRVFFARSDVYYGTERDTVETGNWEQTPAYSKDIATNVTGAAGVMPVWGDLAAEYNNYTSSWSNQSDLDDRAQEIADNIKNAINTAHRGRRKIYGGIHNAILPGSEIREVVWRDYGDQYAMSTEIISGPDRVEPYKAAAETVAPIEVARKTKPVYPHVAQMVCVTGDENDDGVYPGVVYNYNDGNWTALDNCWLMLSTSAAKNNDIFGPARLCGMLTVDQDERPVYLFLNDSDNTDLRIGYLDEALVRGGSADMSVYEMVGGVWADTGDTILVYEWTWEPGRVVDAGQSVVVAYHSQSGCWIVVEYECP